MDKVIEWTRQIFALSIISKLVIHLMPSDKYVEYARTVCRFIITAMCIMPFINLMNSNISFSTVYDYITKRQSIISLNEEMKFNKNDVSIIDACRLEVKEQVEKMALECQLYPTDTQIEIDNDMDSEMYGSLMKISITVSDKKNVKSDINVDRISIGNEKNISGNEKCNELKQKLTQYFKLNSNNVNVYLNGD